MITEWTTSISFQLARALVPEIFTRRRLQRVATVAAETFDAKLAAIRQAGPDHQKICDALAATDSTKGIIGPIRFDASGNRAGTVHLVILGR